MHGNCVKAFKGLKVAVILQKYLRRVKPGLFRWIMSTMATVSYEPFPITRTSTYFPIIFENLGG